VGLHWVGPDGTILWANKAEMDSSATCGGISRHHIAEFHADPRSIEDILCRLTNNEELHSYEARSSGERRFGKAVLISSNVYRESGQFCHTRCFTRDITEWRLAEEEVRKRLAAWKVTLASVGDALLSLIPTGELRL